MWPKSPPASSRLVAQLRQLLVHQQDGSRLYHHVAPAEALQEPATARITLLTLASPDKKALVESVFPVKNNRDTMYVAARAILSAIDPTWLALFDQARPALAPGDAH